MAKVYATDGERYIAFNSITTFRAFLYLDAHGDMGKGKHDLEASKKHWKLLDKEVWRCGTIGASTLACYSETDYDIAQDLHELVSSECYNRAEHKFDGAKYDGRKFGNKLK